MSRALPPVGWQSIIEHEPHSTVVCAWLKTVVMLKQPGHFTSMKKELGDCTKRLSLCFRFSSLAEGWRRSRTMVFGGDVCSWGPAWGSRVCWRLGGRRSLSRPEPRAAARSDAFWVFAAASARRGARLPGPRVAARRLF